MHHSSIFVLFSLLLNRLAIIVIHLPLVKNNELIPLRFITYFDIFYLKRQICHLFTFGVK